MDSPIKFFSLHGNDDTVCIGWQIHCLLYMGFLLTNLVLLIKEISIWPEVSSPSRYSIRGGWQSVTQQ